MRRITALARLLPGRRYACLGYGATLSYTAAMILISTLYFGFISFACTVQRTGA